MSKTRIDIPASENKGIRMVEIRQGDPGHINGTRMWRMIYDESYPKVTILSAYAELEKR